MADEKDLYLAVDVGGTKILAALVDASGMVLWREKSGTPREKGAEPLFEALDGTVSRLLAKSNGLELGDLKAMGIAVPGVVDPDEGLVVVTPNMGLSNTRLGEHCAKTFSLPVAIGNDCNTFPTQNCSADCTGDNIVGVPDFVKLIGQIGNINGPSGITNSSRDLLECPL